MIPCVRPDTQSFADFNVPDTFVKRPARGEFVNCAFNRTSPAKIGSVINDAYWVHPIYRIALWRYIWSIVWRYTRSKSLGDKPNSVLSRTVGKAIAPDTNDNPEIVQI